MLSTSFPILALTVLTIGYRLEQMLINNYYPLTITKISANGLPIFEIIVAFFAISWLLVSSYNLYPLIQHHISFFAEGSETNIYTNKKIPENIEEHPQVDVLLPAYKEGNVIGQAIESLQNTNYPSDCLNINVLVEPDDGSTRKVLKKLENQYSFREIVVPDTYPGESNKPRALNFGFERTNGDIVGIIDAEDIVQPDLFQKVVGAIEIDGEDYVQGILDMVNEDDGWKNLLFRGEYGYWFQVLLPAYYRANYPLPLGGTTNFFDRKVLEEASELRKENYGVPWTEDQKSTLAEMAVTRCIPWNPENVTEDFELGLLLWENNYDCGLVNAVTLEESPLSYSRWIKQRTRWQKGKIQTLFQYFSHPPDTVQAKIHMIGQSFVPHYGPINIIGIISVIGLVHVSGYRPTGFLFGVLLSGLAFVVLMLFLQLYSYWKVTDAGYQMRIFRGVLSVVTLPAYWVLQWLADLRALKQIYLGDKDWEKTEHHGRNMVAVGQENSSSQKPKTNSGDD